MDVKNNGKNKTPVIQWKFNGQEKFETIQL
jgi:hypothetical protein